MIVLRATPGSIYSVEEKLYTTVTGPGPGIGPGLAHTYQLDLCLQNLLHTWSYVAWVAV